MKRCTKRELLREAKDNESKAERLEI